MFSLFGMISLQKVNLLKTKSQKLEKVDRINNSVCSPKKERITKYKIKKLLKNRSLADDQLENLLGWVFY
jgi:hypothetical protein